MRILIRGKVLLASAYLLAGSAVCAQQSQKPAERVSTDLAFTVAAERAQLIPNECCFWLKGVGADASFNFWKGLGVAGALNSGTGCQRRAGSGYEEDFPTSPVRATHTLLGGGRPGRMANGGCKYYAQGLFGGVHGYAGLYPSV